MVTLPPHGVGLNAAFGAVFGALDASSNRSLAHSTISSASSAVIYGLLAPISGEKISAKNIGFYVASSTLMGAFTHMMASKSIDKNFVRPQAYGACGTGKCGSHTEAINEQRAEPQERSK